MISRLRFYCVGWAVALSIVALDWVTKFLIVRHFQLGEGMTIIPNCFDLRFVLNPGAAWGSFAGHRWPLVALGVVAVVGLTLFARKLFGQLYAGATILGLLLGGIIGNLIDRIQTGYVIDFLDFYWKNHHFPAFNVADSAICVSVFALMAMQWYYDRKKARAN